MALLRKKSSKKFINKDNPKAIKNSEFLIMELKRSMKDLKEKALEEKKLNCIDFDLDINMLDNGLDHEYELSREDRMEIELCTDKTSWKDQSKILQLFKHLSIAENNPENLPLILKSCILKVLDERSKDNFGHWLNRTIGNLKKISPSCRITPLNS